MLHRVGLDTDAESALRRRLEIAQTELAARTEFRFVVVNDDLDRAVDELDAIYLQYTG